MTATAIAIYVGVLFAVSAWSARGMHSFEDYALAGRRLGLGLAAPTLLATWFGAGTLMAATDEVHRRGLSAATLDPLGAGICLLVAGAFVAGPMYRMRLTTLPDLFARRVGARAEKLGGVMMVPTYLGWVAAQFMALGQLTSHVFGIPLSAAIVAVFAVGTSYTWLGGMWAVTLTDALQMGFIVAGLIMMGWSALAALESGPIAPLPEEHLDLVGPDVLPWVGVLLAGSLGNLPSQDLLQRIFAARSAKIATTACFVAGFAYLILGAIPVGLGITATALGLQVDGGVITELAQTLLSPGARLVFMLAIVSAVLSTIDSALLAPATVLGQNVFSGASETKSAMARSRLAVLVVAVMSLALAFAGETAYGLLESTYELTMVALLAPMMFSILGPLREGWALAGMVVPSLLWGVHATMGVNGLLGGSFPVGLGCTALSVLLCGMATRRPRPASRQHE